MASSPLEGFLQQLQLASISAQNSGNITCFDKLLSIDVINNEETVHQIAQLQPFLQSLNDQQIESRIKSMNLFDRDWGAFTLLAISYLKLVRDFNPSSILRSHDLFLIYYNDLTVSLLNNQFGNSLAHLFKDTTRFLIPLMKRLDHMLNENVKGKRFKRLIFISTSLTKVFNHLRALKVMSEKKKMIVFIVNRLNMVYFTINNPLLCANIFANMNNMQNFKFSLFAKEEQVEYRYILARYYIIKNQLTKAYFHLNWCFVSNHSSSQVNALKILRYLIPVGLLIGRYPSKRFLQYIPELNEIYAPLCLHLKTGNFIGFQNHVQQYEDYFKSRKLLILLVQRSRILIFRNLIFNTFQLINSHRGNFRLLYDEIQAALNKSINGPSQTQNSQSLYRLDPSSQTVSIDDSLIENMIVSLIENNFLKGNNHTGLRTVILSRKEPFPNVFQQYMGIETANIATLKEAWMN
ncbi:hypothetical protein WICPIJ_008977 [Wickerhamomyces pijperi]|uniref:PCI domain-containing protein n=1 Tax=Wickerhamomyces pijperi TaxID=599730 RepID=A0A9P8TGB3_WICPI|nr:hypothetical protein WICPIJ_008977 [Wickerhamomyces pijperi]